MEDRWTGARPSPRAVAVAVFIVALVAASLGVVVGRRSAAAPAPATGMTGPAATAAAPVPVPPPTAVGPTRVVAEVPVGYAHSPQGALAAATRFGDVLASPLLLHPDAFRAAVAEMAAPQASDAMRAKTETLLSGAESVNHMLSAAAAGLPVVVDGWTLAGRVVAYTGNDATVEVLDAGVIGNGTTPPHGLFDGGQWRLVWTPVAGQGEDWRVAEIHDLSAWASTPSSWPQDGLVLPFLTGLEPVDDAGTTP